MSIRTLEMVGLIDVNGEALTIVMPEVGNYASVLQRDKVPFLCLKRELIEGIGENYGWHAFCQARDNEVIVDCQNRANN